MATCGEDGVSKYVLGPVEIDGSEIQDATSGYQPGPNGQPTSIVEVALSFKESGWAQFAEDTKRLVGQQDSRRSRPVRRRPRQEGPSRRPRRRRSSPMGASITGSFTLDSAMRLAEQPGVRCVSHVVRPADQRHDHAAAR